jgi:hypothetical protein
VAAVVVVACLVAVVAWRVDARSRDRDEGAVAACGEAALRADARATSAVLAMVLYIDPALYVVPAERRPGLVAVVADAAQRVLPGVRRALDLCRRTEVAWLHRDLTQRRTRYVDYLAARVRRLEEVAANGESYYRDQPRLAELRDRAFGT